MNDAQTSLHWRRWGAVVRANAWRMAKGRIVDEARRDTSVHHRNVWLLAEQLAVRSHRAVIVDDLRHACYALAACKNSSSELGNKDFNRVLALWNLLIDPDN